MVLEVVGNQFLYRGGVLVLAYIDGSGGEGGYIGGTVLNF